MSTSDATRQTLNPPGIGSEVQRPTDPMLGGPLDPMRLARMANDFFRAAQEGALPADTAGALPADWRGTVLPPASIPAAAGDASMPVDPQSSRVPSSAGPATAAPMEVQAQSTPIVPGSLATSSPDRGPQPSAFSFLRDVRPIFGDVPESPLPKDEWAAPQGIDTRPNFDLAALSSAPPPQVSEVPLPPSPTVPGALSPVDNSAFPVFSFLEEARPMASSTPSLPGPVPAMFAPESPWRDPGTPIATADEDIARGAIDSIPGLGFLEAARSITPDTAGVDPPPPTQHDVPQEMNVSSYSFDAEASKRDFPILRERVNGRPLIWLDNAATTQKPQSVLDRLKFFYEHENSNVHRAAHELAARATDAYESAREKVRRFLNASSVREIVFVRGATEGINLVAQSWGRQNIHKDDEIVITWLEHHANIVPWQMLCSDTGARLLVAPVDSTGQVLLDEFEKLLGPRTRLVAFAQVSNALGVVTPAQEIIEAAHRHGARVLLDGAQSVSHMPVDVQSLGCDFFIFSGHKVYAPTGIGVVYGKSEVLEHMPPWQGGGNMIQDVTFERTLYQLPPQRFEAGTGNIGDAVGLGAAIDYVERVGMVNVARHEHALLQHATRELLRIPGLHIIGLSKEKAGVISFVMNGFRTDEIGNYLNRDGIAVRSGHHCAQPILRRFGLESTVRASLALYNTVEDIDSLVRSLWNLRFGRTTIA